MGLKLFFISWHLWASVIVNQSVGRVGELVVTSREVRISQRIEQLMSPHEKTPQVKAEAEADPQEVTALLLELVVSLEAENFSVGQVSDDEVETVLTAVKKKSGYFNLEKETQVSDEELKKVIRRKLVSKNFIQFKTNSFTSSISDEEAKAFYEANPKRFSGAGFDILRENIKNFISQQQLNERLKSWFELLKRKYRVRNFLLEEA